MKIIFRLYSASCLVVIAFFAFYGLYVDSLFDLGPVAPILMGTLILVLAAAYVHRKREGFDLGWFLVRQSGFWIITAAAFGFVLLISGLLFWLMPSAVENAYERGSWTVAGILVVLFWFAFIYMFALLSVMMTAGSIASIRSRTIGKFVSNFLVTVVCVAMAGLFLSLFLEVINDIFAPIAVETQWTVLRLFLAVLILAGIAYGLVRKPADLLDGSENDS